MRYSIVVAVVIRCWAACCGETTLPIPPEKTIVSASLDVPHQKGQNLIWCNTFQLAWNAMGHDFCGEAVRLEGTPPFEQSMNSSTVSAKDVDAESIFVKVGEAHKGFIDDINTELKKRFGANAPPPLEAPQTKDKSMLAYAFLYKSLAFVTPLDKQREPLQWAGDDGARTPLEAFGIIMVRANSVAAGQILIINDKRGEYIIELKTKSDADHLILAQVKPGATLKDTVDAVRKKVAKPDRAPFAVQVSDSCLVPCVDVALEHAYKEIIGKKFLNPKLREYYVGDARQNIRFKLDESGAVLKSEAHYQATKNGHTPREIEFDRPFLLYIQRDKAANPYLAIWFDNPNLFKKAKDEPKDKAAK